MGVMGHEAEFSRSDVDIEDYVAGVGSELQNSVREAQVVLLPADLGEDHPRAGFPEGTREVLRQLQIDLTDAVLVEAAVEEDDYAEYAYRSIDLVLPIIYIAQSGLLPVVVGVLVSYLSRVLPKTIDDATVTSEIHVASAAGDVFKIWYKGPVEAFEGSVTPLVSQALQATGLPSGDETSQ